MAKYGDTSGGVSLEDRNAEDDVTQQEEEQKQFSLANTKIYVYSSREIPEIAKLAPKDCENVESEQLLHRLFLYSTQLSTSI